MRLHLTTTPGLEDLVEDELRARAEALGLALGTVTRRPEGLAGVLEVELEDGLEAVPEALWRPLRSIHHALLPLDRFTLPSEAPLAFVAQRAAELPREIFRDAHSFRVTGLRSGAHPFTSMDLARAVGGVVHDASGLAVKMKGYDLELRAQVVDADCRLSVQLSHHPLSRRYPDKQNLRTALSANVAYALLTLTLEDRAPRALLDPTCGTGTILLEAAQLYPEVRLYGGELSERVAAIAQANLAGAGLGARGQVRAADARELHTVFADVEGLDAVVCNPPFGARLGANLDFAEWYGRFLDAFVAATEPGARLGILVLKRAAFKRAVAERAGLRLARARQIGMGKVEPYLYVVERV